MPIRMTMKIISRNLDAETDTSTLEVIGVDSYRGAEVACQMEVARAARAEAARSMKYEQAQIREMAGKIPGRFMWTATAMTIGEGLRVHNVIINSVDGDLSFYGYAMEQLIGQDDEGRHPAWAESEQAHRTADPSPPRRAMGPKPLEHRQARSVRIPTTTSTVAPRICKVSKRNPEKGSTE